MEEYFAKKCTFEYKQEMEYLWFSYMRTYILGYTKSDVKKKIIKRVLTFSTECDIIIM